MSESWYRDVCPFCKKVNFWCNGDENDLTVIDAEGIKCWSCKKTWSIEDEKLVNEEDVYLVEGQIRP